MVLMIFPIYTSSNLEKPFMFKLGVEQPSPSNWIKENQIKVYDDKIIIEIENAEWAKFTNTNSMDPVIDVGANAIEIVPKSYKDIRNGDIISYEFSQDIIIHRVIETGFDSNGWYARTKGDNLEHIDPYKIRFENIRRIVVAIIY
jgi:signal peptidase I